MSRTNHLVGRTFDYYHTIPIMHYFSHSLAQWSEPKRSKWGMSEDFVS